MRAHPDLNQGPADLQSAALTTELCTQVLVGVSRSNKLQTVLPKKGPEAPQQIFGGSNRRPRRLSQPACSVATGRPKRKHPRGRSLWGCVKKRSALWRMKFSPAGDSRKEIRNMSWLRKSQCKSGHPESNQGPSDSCKALQADALPTEL